VKEAVRYLYGRYPVNPIALPYRPFRANEPDANDVAADTPVYDLNTCRRGGEYLGRLAPADPQAQAFAEIAYADVAWSNELEKLGYPASVVQPALARYERRQVDAAIADPNSKTILGGQSAVALKRELRAYRAAHGDLPDVVWSSEVGCTGGGGGSYVSIATDPAGAQVLFIPMFFYQVCLAEKIDANNPATCPHWVEAIAGKLEQVEGNYLYRARWSDGKLRTGTLRFDTAKDGTITLRKP
jgi:hypothetical protein